MSNLPAGPLDDEAIYSVTGAALNLMYNDGFKQLTRAGHGYEQKLPFNYPEAYWSGYACAVNGVRDIVREYRTDDSDS